MTSKKILVGVDGSAPSIGALDWAVRYAQRHEAPLHIVSAYSTPAFAVAALDGGYAALDDSAVRAGAQAALDEAVARAGSVPVEAEIVAGDATTVLVQESARSQLSVVGTRGRGGFTNRLLGTVSSALPAHGYCPTVVVPVVHPARGGLLPMESTNVGPIDRIVVGADSSPRSARALEYALAEAKVWGSSVTVVTGVPIVGGIGLMAWLPAPDDHERVLADVRAELDRMVDGVLESFPGMVVRRIVLDGSGAELLTEFSAAADLIVVGSRGRGGFAGVLLGSTSNAVLHHSACPVMVVGPHAGV